MKQIGLDDFRQRWAAQHDEWEEIGRELIAAGKQPSARDISREQESRSLRDGRTLVGMRRVDGAYVYVEMTPSEAAAQAREINAELRRPGL